MQNDREAMMDWLKISGAVMVVASLAACDVSSYSAQAYPGRTQVQLMSADQVTARTYACQPGDTERQTQARAASAHRYVDRAIQNARSRIAGQSAGGFGANLGVQAEVNAEIAQISRQAEAEYRCVLISSKDTSSGLFGL